MSGSPRMRQIVGIDPSSPPPPHPPSPIFGGGRAPAGGSAGACRHGGLAPVIKMSRTQVSQMEEGDKNVTHA
eukprot:8051430-Pyramimonas_sp.AAC.2